MNVANKIINTVMAMLAGVGILFLCQLNGILNSYSSVTVMPDPIYTPEANKDLK